jgi:hypothetical protein
MHKSTSFIRLSTLFIFSACFNLLSPVCATDHEDKYISTTTSTTTSIFPYLGLPDELKYQVLSSAVTPEKDGFCLVSPFTLRLVNHFSRSVMDQCVIYPVRAFNLQKFWNEDGSVHDAGYGKQFFVEGWVFNVSKSLKALQSLPPSVGIKGHLLGSYSKGVPEWLVNINEPSPHIKITLTQITGSSPLEMPENLEGITVRYLDTMWNNFCDAYGDNNVHVVFRSFLETHPTHEPLWTLLDAMKAQMRAPFSSTLFMSPYVIPLGSHGLNHTLEQITAVCTPDFQRSMPITNLASFWMGAAELTPDQWHAKIKFIERADVSIFGRHFLWENVLPSVASASSRTMFEALELIEAQKVCCPFNEIEMTYLFCALCRYPSSEERFNFLIDTLEDPMGWRAEVSRLELAKGNITYSARSDKEDSGSKKSKRSKFMPSNEKCIIS